MVHYIPRHEYNWPLTAISLGRITQNGLVRIIVTPCTLHVSVCTFGCARGGNEVNFVIRGCLRKAMVGARAAQILMSNRNDAHRLHMFKKID